MKSIFNVKDFGAIADGVTLCTQAVQNAIDECGKKGGTVLFSGGEFVLSTVFLKSNVRIQIEKDAKILGSLNFYDYCQQEEINYPIYQDASHTYFHLSMFVGLNCNNVAICGLGTIDMRSVWDEDGVRGEEIKHRGAKCIALKECTGVEISGLNIINATDLAVYFAGCNDVDVHHLRLRVYIDGISPDNSKNVRIYDCDVTTGDDGIVFKSSYTLNRIDVCKDITVKNCKIKSRCSAIKFGTETNGGFYNVFIQDIEIYDTRITGIAIESVDGAIIDGITIQNVKMQNVNAPLFMHVGKRMRGPSGLDIGAIQNVTIKNLTVTGPYVGYETVAWNYFSFKAGDTFQYPWIFGVAESFDDTLSGNTEKSDWQMTSNVCGLKGYPIKNVTLKDVSLKLDGGVKRYKRKVPLSAQDYPEVYVYGRILPAKGIYFRFVQGLTLDNVKVSTYRTDAREDFVFDSVENLTIN